MRTGADYRKALRDGRRVWVMGMGWAADIATHEATRAMVEEYALWYDRHRDPAWREALLRPCEPGAEPLPWAYVAPKSADDLVGMGRSFARTIFLGAGNITHTPAYGNLIALGVLTAAQSGGAPAEQIKAAAAYRDDIARTGRFLTYCGGAPIIGQRLRPDPAERVALKLVRESAAGIVISGRLGMHTSPAFAEDVYVGALSRLDLSGRPVSFIVPVNAPGVTILCRRPATRDDNPFVAPLSSRFDELDGQMWLDEVTIPRDRIFFVDSSPEAIAALAQVAPSLRLARQGRIHPRPGAGAGRRDGAEAERADGRIPDRPRHHGADRAQRLDRRRARPRLHAGRLLLPAPRPSCSRRHPVDARAGADVGIVAHHSRLLARRCTRRPRSGGTRTRRRARGSFGGGGYTALQRSALLQMAWDHVSSALDGRESAFEAHASGGMPNWRHWLRRSFRDYNALANAVASMLGLPMPKGRCRQYPHRPDRRPPHHHPSAGRREGVAETSPVPTGRPTRACGSPTAPRSNLIFAQPGHMESNPPVAPVTRRLIRRDLSPFYRYYVDTVCNIN